MGKIYVLRILVGLSHNAVRHQIHIVLQKETPYEMKWNAESFMSGEVKFLFPINPVEGRLYFKGEFRSIKLVRASKNKYQARVRYIKGENSFSQYIGFLDQTINIIQTFFISVFEFLFLIT